jgi:hypothetical protein
LSDSRALDEMFVAADGAPYVLDTAVSILWYQSAFHNLANWSWNSDIIFVFRRNVRFGGER